MMRVKKLFLAASLCVLGFTVVLPGSVLAAPEFELSFNLSIPPTHTRWEKVLKGWVDEIDKRSNGRIKVVPYFSGALSRQGEAFDSVKSGVADITETTFNSGGGQLPAHEAMFNALLPSRAIADPSQFINTVRDKFPQMKTELDGAKLLFMHAHPVALMIGTSKPVTSLADLKGRKISMYGSSVVSDKLLALGVSPIQLQGSEEYMAIQQGVVDGMMIEFDQLVSRRFGELIKNMTLINVGCTGFFAVMNQDVYDSMPDDLKAVIDGVSGEYMEKLMEDYWNNQEFASLKTWLSTMNGSLYMLTDEEYSTADKAVSAVVETSWVNNIESRGYDGKKLLESIRAIEQQYNPQWKDYDTAAYLKK